LKTIIENNNAIHQQQIASLKNDLEEEKKLNEVTLHVSIQKLKLDMTLEHKNKYELQINNKINEYQTTIQKFDAQTKINEKRIEILHQNVAKLNEHYNTKTDNNNNINNNQSHNEITKNNSKKRIVGPYEQEEANCVVCKISLW